MTVTIKDVAREAQVSVATVSRALNGQDNVAEAVRHRVQVVAERLRYTPHHAARSLSSRRTRTIGVVLPEVYYSGLVGIQRSQSVTIAGLAAYVADPAKWLKEQTGDASAKSKMTFKLAKGGEDMAAYLASVKPAAN